MDGETLADRIGKGKLSLSGTLRYGVQIADVLAAAHAGGIVHRDLKPGNITLAWTGVKVLDLGLAKSTEDEAITATRAVIGRLPTWLRSKREGRPADTRDIFALGLVLSEMASGTRVPAGTQPDRSSPAKASPVVLSTEPWYYRSESSRLLGLALWYSDSL